MTSLCRLRSGENVIYGLANACDESLAFSYMMEEMGQDFSRPAILRCDAKTAEVSLWHSTTLRQQYYNDPDSKTLMHDEKDVRDLEYIKNLLN